MSDLPDIDDLAEFRSMALERMGSRVVIRRKTGRTVVKDRMQVPEWEKIPTTGGDLEHPFRLGGSRSGASPSRTVRIGDVEVTAATRTGNLPAGTDLRDLDHLEIVAGEHPGRVFIVVEATAADQQTALRPPLIETTRPKEWT